LLSDRLAIRQVLGSIDDSDQGSNLWAVHCNVGKDTGSVRRTHQVLDLGCHCSYTHQR
jgi:hypothetical protein